MNDADIIRAEVNEPHINEAISIWEKGVLKEKDGSMSDAINYYRKAIKIHDGVDREHHWRLCYYCCYFQ